MRGESASEHAPSGGFTLLELVVVVLILGILIAVSIPILFANVANVKRKTCFANQRTIDSAVAAWASQGSTPLSELNGVIGASHPLITDHMLMRAPRCPSSPEPVDPDNPYPTTGAYSLEGSATLVPCPFGNLGTHGSY